MGGCRGPRGSRKSPRGRRSPQITLQALTSYKIPKSKSKYDIYQQQLNQKRVEATDVWNRTVKELAVLSTVTGLYEERKRVEDQMFILASFGIFMVFLEHEVDSGVYHGLEESSHDAPTEAFKYMISISTILLLIKLYQRYSIHCRVSVLTYKIPPLSKFYYPSSGMLGLFLLEAFICMIHIPPHVNAKWISRQFYSVGEKPVGQNPTVYICPPTLVADGSFCYNEVHRELKHFGFLILLRLYLFGRFVRNQAGFHSKRVTCIGILHSVDTSAPWFSVKCLFRKYPGLITILSLLVVWVTTSMAISIVEGSVNEDIHNLGDSCWLTIVTMSTTGYGDIVPVTNYGRIVMSIGGILGGTITASILTAVMVDSLTISPDEQHILDVFEVNRWSRKTYSIAAFLIQASWKYYRARMEPQQRLRTMIVLYEKAMVMRAIRLGKPIMSRPIEEVLRECSDKLEAVQFNQPSKERLQALDERLTDTLQRLQQVINGLDKQPGAPGA